MCNIRKGSNGTKATVYRVAQIGKDIDIKRPPERLGGALTSYHDLTRKKQQHMRLKAKPSVAPLTLGRQGEDPHILLLIHESEATKAGNGPEFSFALNLINKQVYRLGNLLKNSDVSLSPDRPCCQDDQGV